MITPSTIPRLACWLALLALPAAALAEEPGPSPLQEPPPPSMQAYGERTQDCLEWTDSCRVCRRLDPAPKEEAGIACSTPGIACQPGDIICRETRAKDAKE